ncbi:hypothetical protein [Xenorhabdus nematophila]|uniref:hypothetical protein n=1 Tax=Xenorhabdus nematophila TaxID=628 RepID=UPI00398800D3
MMEKIKNVDAVEFTVEDKKSDDPCGMMPWLTKFAKEAPSKAFGMVMASLCIAPVYGKLCELVIHAIQGA